MSSPPDSPHVRLVAARVHGRHVVSRPPDRTARGWLVGFHGYAQSAEVFLDGLRAAPGSDAWIVSSVQALHPFYDRANNVIANWMTSQDREHAIADNIAYVDAVLDDLEEAFGAPPAIVFAGFSQGVAMAYRAGLLGRRRASAIVAAGGDLPPDPAIRALTSWPRVVVCTGARDTWFTPERAAADVDYLRRRGGDAHAVVFEGGHEWAREVSAAVGEELERAAQV
jgi:predicted esterase